VSTGHEGAARESVLGIIDRGMMDMDGSAIERRFEMSRSRKAELNWVVRPTSKQGVVFGASGRTIMSCLW
jgi:hypothetical protein